MMDQSIRIVPDLRSGDSKGSRQRSAQRRKPGARRTMLASSSRLQLVAAAGPAGAVPVEPVPNPDRVQETVAANMSSADSALSNPEFFDAIAGVTPAQMLAVACWFRCDSDNPVRASRAEEPGRPT